MSERKRLVVPGLPDDSFVRGEVPLTKEEIRCLTLSKLRLEADSRVLDIGAGSGGVTVECALLAAEGTVCAVERDPGAVRLIRANCNRFELKNVRIIEGEAPGALEGLGDFERIVIGGSGGSLEGVIAGAASLLVPGGIIVINAILVETLGQGLALLKDQGFHKVDFIQAAISRSRELGGGRALLPLNPVFIIAAEKGAA